MPGKGGCLRSIGIAGAQASQAQALDLPLGKGLRGTWVWGVVLAGLRGLEGFATKRGGLRGLRGLATKHLGAGRGGGGA